MSLWFWYSCRQIRKLLEPTCDNSSNWSLCFQFARLFITFILVQSSSGFCCWFHHVTGDVSNLTLSLISFTFKTFRSWLGLCALLWLIIDCKVLVLEEQTFLASSFSLTVLKFLFCVIVDFAARELLAKLWRYFKNNTNCPRLCDLCRLSVLKSLTRLSAVSVGGADRKFWRREKEKMKKKNLDWSDKRYREAAHGQKYTDTQTNITHILLAPRWTCCRDSLPFNNCTFTPEMLAGWMLIEAS